MRRNILLLLIFLFILISTGFSKQKLFHVETIETSMTPDNLWNLVAVSIENPTATSLWPKEYEELQSTRLIPGNVIQTLYKTPFGNLNGTYTITGVRFGILEYSSGSHNPLVGKHIISVIPRPDGSALSWQIEYQYGSLNPIGWYTKLVFAPSFFSTLKKNLQQINVYESTH